MKYLTFPWEQLGNLLRRLSLSGGVGNLAAWILFLTLGLCPLAALAWLLLRKRSARADWLLLLISALLLTGSWFFVNPSYLEKVLFPTGLGEAGMYAFALTIDSAVLTWLLLRFMSGYESRERGRLFREMRVVLLIYILLSAGGLLFRGVETFAEKYAVITAGNRTELQGVADLSYGAPRNRGELELSYVFLLLQILCALLPEVLELVLWCVVLTLLRSCETDGFSAESRKKVELLKNLSARFVAAVLFANLGINLLQLLAGKKLHSTHFSLTFPLRETVVLLGVLLLSCFYLEGGRLKEDNDLFI